jgi:putative phosphoesterase
LKSESLGDDGALAQLSGLSIDRVLPQRLNTSGGAGRKAGFSPGKNPEGWRMTRIGVISDTHIVEPGQGLRFMESLRTRIFSEADMILHAGDIVNPEILCAFFDIPVHAVRGNMDSSLCDFPVKRVLGIGGFRIGLIHGWGAPSGLEQRLVREFTDEKLDCLVYGHSHMPACHRRDGVLFFNPGSPTQKRHAPWPSVGMLELSASIDGRIIRLE